MATFVLHPSTAGLEIQVVIDLYTCVRYIHLTKYVAKGEPISQVMKQAFNSIVIKADNSTEPQEQ